MAASVKEGGGNTRGDYAVFAILFFTNILNYVDRYTMAGVLTGIQTDFEIDDAHAGLLQTSFITALAIGSPLFGYLGDRYNRKLLIIIGLSIWTASVLGSSFIPHTSFVGFITMRACFGFGQAAYVTISPSLIADTFNGERRALMLMLYYFAIPVGSGLGFIVGSKVASVANDWRWGIRAPSFLDFICLVLLIFFVHDRQIPVAEHESVIEGRAAERSSYKNDLLSLAKNATFMTSTFAYTAVVFVTGTLSWWIPSAMQHVQAMTKNLNSTKDLQSEDKARTTFIFGIITIISGFSGVAAGSVLSNLLSSGKWCFSYCRTPRSDPIICAVGTLIGVPSLFAVMQLIPINMYVAEVFMFVCITGLCFIWATNVNLYISVVAPNKRNTANGIQILLSHVLGDGSGPYIIGVISDAIRGPDDHSPGGNWSSLSKAFYVANAILIPAVILFIIAAITYPRDRTAFLRSTNGSMVEIAELATTAENGATNKVTPSDKTRIPVKLTMTDPALTPSSPPRSPPINEKTAIGE